MKTTLLSVFLFLCIFNLSAQDRNTDVDKFLISFVKKGDLKAKDVYQYIITDKTVSKKSGVTHIYFKQAYDGIGIIDTESSVHILPSGKILTGSNKFINNINEKVQTTDVKLSAKEAILSVISKMNYTKTETISEVSNTNRNVFIFSHGGVSRRNIPVKKVLITSNYSKPFVAWELSIYEISKKNWYNFYVNAKTGDIVRKNNWALSCKEHNHHPANTKSTFNYLSRKNNNTSTINGAFYNVFALPLESPLYGSRTLEVDPHDVIASPYGWHDTNGIVGSEYTVTRGNNTNTYEDGDNPGYQPDGGVNLNFDFTFDPVFSASSQSEDAAITNLFYWTNVTHDILHHYGFDEQNGNFQETNYSGLGLGNDHVLAESQDSFGSCNAVFASPPDGTNGVMQMFTCNDRDGSVDNQVIIHEYGHGISTRLTGGPSNSDCLFNDEQMGEGWSDWYGTIITMNASSLPNDLRPVGNWLFGQTQNGPGIRDFPYTTDLSQDPRTYDYIKTTFGPHPLGSTWTAMLWELTWELINVHGFDPDLYNGTGGNNIALALVTESLKLQPCSPGFIDGRDAILAADLALYNGANQCVIWDAFAKRGLGFSATQGSSNSRTDGTEAFDSLSTSLTTPNTSFCILEPVVTLDGGLPLGGVYSGPGVTDDGNGQTYTFNPSVAGVGMHTITYTANTPCTTNGTATSTIEVNDEQPVIDCQDIDITLDSNGTATIIPQDIVTNFLPADGYTIDQSGVFNPEDISSIGTSVSLGDDQVSSNLPIGFDFTFFTNTYNSFYLSSNGFLTFDNSSSSGCCSGQNIPDNNTPNNLIAFGWTDLYPPGNGVLRYATIGTAPNRILIIDAVDIPACCNSTPQVTAQVKIFENSNIIEIHSAAVSGFSLTQGIENQDGTDAYYVSGRNASTTNYINDFVSFIPNLGGFPDTCGFQATVTLDVDTFDCTNIGANTVTATATNTNGDSTSCIATVTISPNTDTSFNLNNLTYCIDESINTGLSGGLPLGGIYSGLGVTDDGNGTSFSFDPSLVPVGSHTITYTTNDSCGNSSSADVDIEILPAIPQITCQDIQADLDGTTGTVTITPEQLIANASGIGDLYAFGLNASQTANIARYSFDPNTNSLNIDTSYSEGTQINTNYAVDRNPTNGLVYILSGAGSSNPRDLYLFDVEATAAAPVLIGNITSVNGNTRPQDMAFDNNGILYFIFQSGEINSYDINTQTMSSFTNTTVNGAVGLTYDYDNNRLLLATNRGPVSLSAIDINTGNVNNLFTFNTPGLDPACTAQGIEYIGNDSLIASSTHGCDIIYTVDLTTQTTLLLANPTGSFTRIKDLLFISNTITDNCNNNPLSFSLSNDTFDCTNIGANTVTVTATDTQGNSTSCTATVTVLDPTNYCMLSNDSNTIDDNSIRIFPNPANRTVTLSWDNIYVKKIELFDMNGRLIITQKLKASENLNSKDINVSNLQESIYLIKIESERNNFYKRLIIKK